MIEIFCECGGFIYRKGLDDNSYACVRCEQPFTQADIDGKWLKKFEKNHTLPDKQIKK